MPVFIAAADSGVVVDGNSFIDLGSGIAVTSVGNAAPAVVTAVQARVEQFTHTCFMVTPYEPYLVACEELARVTPGEHEKRSALFNSGAEAVENAVKVARHATDRAAVVVFDHAYRNPSRSQPQPVWDMPSILGHAGDHGLTGKAYIGTSSYPVAFYQQLKGSANIVRSDQIVADAAHLPQLSMVWHDSPYDEQGRGRRHRRGVRAAGLLGAPRR